MATMVIEALSSWDCQHPPTGWTSLPADLQIKILSFLPVVDILSFLGLSRAARAAALAALHASTDNVDLSPLVGARAGAPRRLAGLLAVVRERCPNIRGLRIQGAKHVALPSECVAPALQNLRRLEILDATDMSTTAMSTFVYTLFGGHTAPPESDMGAHTIRNAKRPHLPAHLEALRMVNCTKCDVPQAFVDMARSVRHVEFQATAFSMQGAHRLRIALSVLETFVVDTCIAGWVLDDSAGDLYARADSEWPGEADEVEARNGREVQEGKLFPATVRALRLPRARPPPSGTMVMQTPLSGGVLLQHPWTIYLLTLLRQLDLSMIEYTSEFRDAIKAVGEGAAQAELVELRMAHMYCSVSWLEDQDLQNIAKSFPKLEVLDLSGHDKLTDAGVASLKGLPRLWRLRLSRCHNIGAGLRAVLREPAHALASERGVLELVRCKRLGDRPELSRLSRGSVLFDEKVPEVLRISAADDTNRWGSWR